MNSRRIQVYTLLAVGLGALHALGEVGEFLISEDVIRQIEVITDQTEPFMKKGRRIIPNIQVKVAPSLVNNPDQLALNLGFELNGTSRSSSYTPVTRRKGVSAVVDAKVRAYFEQPLSFDGKELHAGEFTGKTEITPTNIGVSNNFGLLNGVVNRQAQKRAGGQIQAELPQEKRDLEDQMKREIETGLGQARQYLQSTTTSLNQVFSRTDDIPFDSKFSTQKGGYQGGLKLQFTDQGEAPERGSKPQFDLADQISTSGVFHEDLLTRMIAPQIAGKEMKITELRAYLCSDAVRGLLNFCEKDIPVGGVGLSVILDEKDPISFKFQDGKVIIKINAKNRVGLTAGNQVPSGIWGAAAAKPGLGQVDFEPYQVEISYTITDGSAQLDHVKVHGLNSAVASVPNKEKPNRTHKGSDTFSGMWRRLSDGVNHLMGEATESAIEKEYRRIMKDKIDFPVVSFPIKAKANKKQPGKLEILEAGTMLPLEVKSENGWFALSAALCTEKMKALGVVFDGKNRVSQVQPGSPAAKVGFRVGDSIQSYGSQDQRATALGADIQPFLDFIKDKSQNKGTQQRLVELAGKTEDGIPFKRSVSLCPPINHRKEAEAFLTKAQTP